jgi:hypothetical protein
VPTFILLSDETVSWVTGSIENEVLSDHWHFGYVRVWEYVPSDVSNQRTTRPQ